MKLHRFLTAHSIAVDEGWAPIPWNRGPDFITPFGPQAPVFGRPGFTGGGSGLTGVGVTVTVGVGAGVTVGVGVEAGVTVGVGVEAGVTVGVGVGVGALHTG